ncbi:NAD(P)H-hydrate dehydratase [Candidatus Micrarchaeota archaeon]|nr:NAD(P)H-hydrate dehydratase [Candidatus Micrarchaeota archaeon]
MPPKDSHKGMNGKLMIIGGSGDYHGAPMFSILAARRFVDLLYLYPAQKDPYLINAVKTIPEAIVVYDIKRIKEMDCTLFGIGLSDAKFNYKKVIKESKKLVIDGDGLKLIKNKIPKGSILTPHEKEFQRLSGMKGTKENVKNMAKKWGCVILKKGAQDIVSDGKKVFIISNGNSGMTKGGTGDTLAGLVSALFCKNDAYASAVTGSYLNRYAGDILKKKYGFWYCASDLADSLAESYKTILKQ